MKKTLSILGIAILVITLSLIGGCFILSEAEPQGTPSVDADKLAEQMMRSVDKAGWDTTRYVQFTFMGRNSYFWDKERNLVETSSGKNKILLVPYNASGKVFNNSDEVTGDKAQKILTKAQRNFFNDSFWLNAVVKAFDDGTVRSIVTLKDGRKGLKVQYMEGGVTPGDSYVWILDDDYKPIAWKMWVQILPIGGLELKWENWITFPTGAKVATLRNGFIDIKLTDVQGGQTLQEFGRDKDPFEALQ